MTVHVLLCIDFEQMCGKHPMRFGSPPGGSDPIVSEPTDGRSVHNASIIQFGAD